MALCSLYSFAWDTKTIAWELFFGEKEGKVKELATDSFQSPLLILSFITPYLFRYVFNWASKCKKINSRAFELKCK